MAIYPVRTIKIDSVEIGPAHRLLIRPRLLPEETLEFIYRTGTGIRWEPQSRALSPVESGIPAHVEWFKRIVDAVRSEYGYALVVTPETLWVNVSADLRGTLEAFARASAV